MKVRELVEEEINGKKKLKQGKNVEYILYATRFCVGYDLDMEVSDFIARLIKEVTNQHDEIWRLAIEQSLGEVLQEERLKNKV